MSWKLTACVLLSGVCVAVAVPSAAVHADDNGIAEAIHTLRREGRRICQVDHFHSGSSAGMPNQKAAMYAAIDSWQGFTAFEYGTDWGNYRKAASKSAKCTVSSGGWGCEVQARPCK